ncbi:hypothetical protein BJ508DRAFT_416361 [Ascobolus immersus RN42]|uniref:Uncharacterized protein n=1 Tax=Ascobolus immersus RN42 TaxID=1160509 RepID=A0A3N4HY30_ASCIM|nr:hypothetical protein BJ508DRAFT_416361 [Ascobolus immersus RN42]
MNSTDTPSAHATIHKEPNTRGTAGLIWTCLLTLILCIWTTVHPNVPGGKRKWYGWLWVRVSWMLMALFAPEVVLYMAYKQNIVARWITKEMPAVERAIRKERETSAERRTRRERERVVKKALEAHAEAEDTSPMPIKSLKAAVNAVRFINIMKSQSANSSMVDLEKNTETVTVVSKELDEKEIAQERQLRKYEWTHYHSYLLTMGGIAFSTYDKAGVQFIPYRYWATLTITGARYIKMIDPTVLRIPKRFIEDKSKASVFFKAFVIFQTAVFIIQCIERLTEHMGITPIELNTCMHVVCAVIMSILWWYKPFGVETPFLVHDEHGLRLGALLYMIDKCGVDIVDDLATLEADAETPAIRDIPQLRVVRDSLEIQPADNEVSGLVQEKPRRTITTFIREILEKDLDDTCNPRKIKHDNGRLLLDSDNRMNDWKLITTVASKMSTLKGFTKGLRRKTHARAETWEVKEEPAKHDVERMVDLARQAVQERPHITPEDWKKCYVRLGLHFTKDPMPVHPRIHPDHEVPQYAAATYELGAKERRMLFVHPVLCLFTFIYGAVHIIFIYTQESVLRSETERLIWVVASSLIAGTSVTFWFSFEGIPKLLSAYRYLTKRLFERVQEYSDSEPSTSPRPSRQNTMMSFGEISRQSTKPSIQSQRPSLTKITSRKLSDGLLSVTRSFYGSVNNITKRLEEVARVDLLVLLLFYFTACRFYLIFECFYTVFYLPEKYFQQPGDGIIFFL